MQDIPQISVTPISICTGHYIYFDLPKTDPRTANGNDIHIHVNYMEAEEPGVIAVFAYAQFNKEATLYSVHTDTFKQDASMERCTMDERVITYLSMNDDFHKTMADLITWWTRKKQMR